MTNNKTLYSLPNLGCMVGTAYQTLLSSLTIKLAESAMGITPPEYMVLRALYTQDGLQQCEIADLIGKDKASVSRTVTCLSRKGLVITQSISHKCLQVFLTSEGVNLRTDIFKIADSQEAELQNILTADEIKAFRSSLEKIITYL